MDVLTCHWTLNRKFNFSHWPFYLFKYYYRTTLGFSHDCVFFCDRVSPQYTVSKSVGLASDSPTVVYFAAPSEMGTTLHMLLIPTESLVIVQRTILTDYVLTYRVLGAYTTYYPALLVPCFILPYLSQRKQPILGQFLVRL